jgi:fibronectin-binding autotransporter adhesin
MALVQWTSSSGGQWLTPADWSAGADPGSGDNVQIEVPSITVTISTGTISILSLTTVGSTLSVTGGTFSCAGTAAIDGAFMQSGGIVDLAGSLTTLGLGATLSGGIFDQQAGELISVGTFLEEGASVTLSGLGATFDAALDQTSGSILSNGNLLTAESGFTQTGGTFTLAGIAVFDGSVTQSNGAIIDETAGLLTDNGSLAESGGAMVLAGNGAVINGPVTLSSGTIEELAGLFTSNRSFTQSGGEFLVEGNGQGANFHGPVVQTGGTFFLGTGALNSFGTWVENGGALQLGFEGGTFNNLLLESGVISSSAPTLLVNGTYEQTGGTLEFLGRDTTFAGAFSQSAGSTIDVQSGALQLEGIGTLSGLISGAGRLLVDGGITTISSATSLTLPFIEVAAGTLALGSNDNFTQIFSETLQGNVALHGHTLTLNGVASLGGEFLGAGTVVMAHGGQLNGLSLDGSTVLSLTALTNETGNISLGNAPGSRSEFVIAKTGALRITGNDLITDASNNGVFDILGTLNKTGGSGTATITTNVVSTGIINVAIGTLDFAGPTGNFGGHIGGNGTFALSSALANAQDSFASGLSLTVSRFLMEVGTEQLTLAHSLSYAGEWSQAGGTLWLDGSGVTLTTTGQTGFDGGLVTGSGTLVTTSTAHLNVSAVDFEGTVTLEVAGDVKQTTSVGFGSQIGSAPTLIIESGAVWTIENNSNLGGEFGQPAFQNGIFTNDGTLQKLNGSANSSVIGDLVNNGTLTVNNSTLTLNGTGTLGGVIDGHGELDLNGTYTLAAGLAVSVGELNTIAGTILLGENLTDAGMWAQSGGDIFLAGNTLTVAGNTSLEGGTLSGTSIIQTLGTVLGSMVDSGTVTLGDGFAVSMATLTITGHADQIGDITIGDSTNVVPAPPGGTLPPSLATLQIAAGASYNLDDSVNINSNGTLAVSGTLSAFGTASVIGPSVIDNGGIFAEGTALKFLGPVSGTGSLVIGGGGALDFAGAVGASNTVSFTTGTGSMLLEDPASGTNTLAFEASVAGFTTGDFIEFSNLQAKLSAITLTLNGAGTVATLTDTLNDTATVTFTTAQTLSKLSIGFGSHGDIALFHT